MENATTVGMNRTGLQMAPLNGSGMMNYAQAKAGEAPEDHGDMQSMHRAYVEEADKLGSVPVPGTVKGIVKSTTQRLMGGKPEVLIDKLGERLAFERTGVRLYEAMMMKVSGVADVAKGNGNGGSAHRTLQHDNAEAHAYESVETTGMAPVGSRVDMPTLQRIRHDEQERLYLVKQALEEMGADPTAMTPCADVVGVTSMGVLQTITDPRTTLAQCLNALLTAELTDHAGWELLMELAEQLGQDDMAIRFSVAATTEAEHLSIVKEWLRSEILQDAGA